MEQKEIKILITGDFAPRLRVNEVIDNGDYADLFGNLIDDIKCADIAVTNLEFPLCDTPSPIVKTGPNMMAPTKSINALKYAGFNMVTLANNHIMDHGVDGLKSTIEECNGACIECVGIGMNLVEARRFKVIERKGIRFAFINCCENEWSTTSGDEPGANPLDEVNLFYQIREAEKETDYTIVIIHGGHESYGLPSPRMKMLYRWFIDIGADAVVGHHAHCYCGREVYKGKPIVYGLGNFLFDDDSFRQSRWNIGCIALIKVGEDGLSCEVMPVRQCDRIPGVSKLEGEDAEAFFSEDLTLMKIIQDDSMLNHSFQDFIKEQARQIDVFLEPTANRYLIAGIKRKFLPSLWSMKKKRYLYNLCHCEALRDILLSVLREETK